MSLLFLTVLIGSLTNAIRLRGLLPPSPNDPPVVVLMDTNAAAGRYPGVEPT
jgi:hypothetical protein